MCAWFTQQAYTWKLSMCACKFNQAYMASFQVKYAWTGSFYNETFTSGMRA